MAIITEDRHFGEGLSNYGEEDAREAFALHRGQLRRNRLKDLRGNDKELSQSWVSEHFEEIKLAIRKADDQAFGDNAEFCKEHNITRQPD